MKFTLSTKPLIDALNLGIVNANVSKFYQKSCLAQISATRNTLKINLEAASVITEIILRGSGDEDIETPVSVFVDSLLLKQLVSTFEVSTTTIEYTEGGLILHSGKSKFTLPKMLDNDAGLELSSPKKPDSFMAAHTIEIDKSDWKFIKDYQMYAIAMSFVHPVYTRVWVGENGDVLVGDFDNSVFTHSGKSKLGKTCLLKDTIINLFNSLPDGAKLVSLRDSYLITLVTDTFEFASEFTPEYESNPDVGSYNSEIILGMMNKLEEKAAKVNVAAINKFLNQAALLSNSTEDTINFGVHDKEMTLVDANVDCKLPVESNSTMSYSVKFKTALLKSVISNLDEEDIYIAPMCNDEEGLDVIGITLWTKNMTTVIAGLDE